MSPSNDPKLTRAPSPAARRRKAAREAAALAARKKQQRRRLLTGALAALAVAVVVLATILIQSSRSNVDTSATPANTAAGTNGTAFAVGEDAAVVVDIYEDFQCPACQQFEAASTDTLAQLVSDGRVQVRYHPIAILNRFSTDEYSTRSANAAAAVADAAGTEAFLAFHGLLFANQPAEGGAGLSDDQLISFAAEAGATGGSVEDAIRDRTFEGWVSTATEQSSQAGVTQTPTVLVDGSVLADRSTAGLTAAVEAAAAG